MLDMNRIVSHFQVGFRLALTLFLPFQSLFKGYFPPRCFFLRFRDVANSTSCFFIVSSARRWRRSILIIPQMALEGERIDTSSVLRLMWVQFSRLMICFLPVWKRIITCDPWRLLRENAYMHSWLIPWLILRCVCSHTSTHTHSIFHHLDSWLVCLLVLCM